MRAYTCAAPRSQAPPTQPPPSWYASSSANQISWARARAQRGPCANEKTRRWRGPGHRPRLTLLFQYFSKAPKVVPRSPLEQEVRYLSVPAGLPYVAYGKAKLAEVGAGGGRTSAYQAAFVDREVRRAATLVWRRGLGEPRRANAHGSRRSMGHDISAWHVNVRRSGRGTQSWAAAGRRRRHKI